jgi:glycine cleavage system H protein
MNFPENIKYAKSHEWVRIEGNTGYIGITDFAQSELGDIVFVDITAGEGDELKRGEAFGTIEAVKTVSDLYMPVAGKIVEINQKIIDTPETINSDPFGDGWMVKVELTDGGDTSSLMDSPAYADMVGKGH